MSFITIEDAERILGADFAPQEDKAQLVYFANIWILDYIGYTPDPITYDLQFASCQIVLGIKSGEILSGVVRSTTSERVKADTVEVEESFSEGSREISEYEQRAKMIIGTLNLKSKGFTIGLYRV